MTHTPVHKQGLVTSAHLTAFLSATVKSQALQRIQEVFYVMPLKGEESNLHSAVPDFFIREALLPGIAPPLAQTKPWPKKGLKKDFSE